ncbi:MAG: hypothetical protein IPM79_33440 [Polyangiaceae bacterium]|jgi:hypothetical protein|nr:hypothetical protein [Polyangiaceae bacterium]MBK8942374.1 hypothetical protein [Polyangiaceae bacterium]
MTRRLLVPTLAFVFGGLVACGTGYPLGAENARPLVLNDAERDLDCPREDIRVKEEWGGTWIAVGCGRKTRYKTNCYGVSCEVHGEDEPPVPFRDRPSPEETSPR